MQALFKPTTPVRVGTGCQVEPALLYPRASDPDGICWVRIRSRIADSPLGLIDTTAECSQLLSFNFPIDSHDGQPDQEVYREGMLDMEVWDGNGGRADTSFKVVTYSNLHPLVEL
jgi:hypothetical protein